MCDLLFVQSIRTGKKKMTSSFLTISGQVKQPEEKLDYAALCFQTVLILLIVAYHVNATGFDGPLGLFPVETYFVQGFAFISGYLYSTRHDEAPLRYCAKRFKRLLVPALLMYLFYGCFVSALRWAGLARFGLPLTVENLTLRLFDAGNQFGLNTPMWFIAPFFVTQCVWVLARAVSLKVFSLFGHFNHATDVAVLLASVALGSLVVCVSGPEPAREGTLGLLLGRVAILLSWIAIGRWYRVSIEPRIDTVRGGWCMVLLVVLLMQPFLFYFSDGVLFCGIAWLEFHQGPLLTYLSGFSCILSLWTVCRMLAPKLGRAGRLLVRTIGKNTMSIMCHHALGFYVLNCLFYFLHKMIGIFGLFDIEAFRSAPFYHYFPHGVGQFAIWYIAFGLVFSLFVHAFWLRARDRARGSLAAIDHRFSAGG